MGESSSRTQWTVCLFQDGITEHLNNYTFRKSLLTHICRNSHNNRTGTL